MNETSLTEALGESQRLGMLGDRPIGEVIEHARHFVTAIRGLGLHRPALVDIGSGGGVPGLVIAHDLPEVQVTLVDRRAKRTDHLERLVRRLGMTGRVSVRCDDLTHPSPDLIGAFDVATARGFGTPQLTVSLGMPLVRTGGWLVISEPPTGDRWNDAILQGCRRWSTPGEPVVVLQRP